MRGEIVKLQRAVSQQYSQKPFRIVKVIFNYGSDPSDRALLDWVKSEAMLLARRVNPHAASHVVQVRDHERIFNNCLAGILSEYLWRRFLNKDQEMVVALPALSVSEQIDLMVARNGKKIEVRSSFPRNGVEFAICHPVHQFDILGPYSGGYKPDEPQKDFYVRSLFHLRRISEPWQSPGARRFRTETLMSRMTQNNFEAYLCGGASWDMMCDDQLATDKHLIADDELSPQRLAQATNYRVIPFSNALDTFEMYELIRGC